MKSKKKTSIQRSNPFDNLELPDGWTITKVRDLVTIKYGKGLKEADRVGGRVSVYGSNGIVGTHNKALTNGPSIIIGRKGSIGEVHYSTTPSWPIDTTYYIDKFEDIDPTFLVFALKLLNLPDLDTSTAIPGLNRNDFYNQEIPLPPLAEQQRIVARVEALLTHVNAAHDRLTRVPLIMKKFRQAVLAAACSGMLTQEWREENSDIENSSQFLERFFKMKVEPFKDPVFNSIELPEIPKSWLWIEFGKVVRELKNGIYIVGPNLEPPGNPILRISSVRPGEVFLDDVKYLINSDKNLEEYHLKDKDLLFTRYNGSFELVGICGMVRGIQGRILIYPDKLIRVRFDPNGVMPEYAEMFFQSLTARTNIYIVIKSSAGQKGISGKDIKIQPFPLPPLAEQKEIVRRVDSLFERSDAIEQQVAAATKRTEALIQAVLAKAFSGEL